MQLTVIVRNISQQGCRAVSSTRAASSVNRSRMSVTGGNKSQDEKDQARRSGRQADVPEGLAPHQGRDGRKSDGDLREGDAVGKDMMLVHQFLRGVHLLIAL